MTAENDAIACGRAGRYGRAILTGEDREAIDRFRTFLKIVATSPRDDEGRYLVGEAAVAYACGEDTDPRSRCTALTATWCPVHGDCGCEREPNGDILAMDDPACPLHSPTSVHPLPGIEAT